MKEKLKLNTSSQIEWSPIELRDDDGNPTSCHVVPVTRAPLFNTAKEAYEYGQYIESIGSPAIMADDPEYPGDEMMLTFIGHTLSPDCSCFPSSREASNGIPMYLHNLVQ